MVWMPKITRLQFEKRYSRNSGIPLDKMLEYQRAYPCECEYENCQGWQMLSKEIAQSVILFEQHRNYYNEFKKLYEEYYGKIK